MTSTTESQLASAVMMIRPVRFQQNPLTADSNAFMQRLDASPAEQQAAAGAQFEALRETLVEAGVEVISFDDTLEPHTPDSVFPNNWVSFHEDGRTVLYPMEAPNRRTERRRDIVDQLVADHGFHISEVVDLSALEKRNVFLEGTGSLVLDRSARIAFACLSSRTHREALEEFGRRMDYQVVAFDAVDRQGCPIYHTNVLMSIGQSIAPICLDSIRDQKQRSTVENALASSGRELLPLSYTQLECFAGNLLEMKTVAGERITAMSQSALNSLESGQRATLAHDGRIVSCDIGDIETSAGGSVRCMLAAIHLPRALN